MTEERILIFLDIPRKGSSKGFKIASNAISSTAQFTGHYYLVDFTFNLQMTHYPAPTPIYKRYNSVVQWNEVYFRREEKTTRS